MYLRLVNHESYMRTCLELAKMGWPGVAPNPMVGCVIVHDNKIVAQGYHQKYGESHAEVKAIENLHNNISPADCTLYVNLEPCSHYGKTPPCADLIIKKGFKKVVIANKDPNPLVAGNGIELLKKNGVEVLTGILEKEARELNKRFFTFHEKKRPFYVLKWAESADGFISRSPVPANRADNMIGDAEQQKQSHRLRSEVMAVIVGKNTVLCDNPSLTVRLVKGKNPVRIFIDRNLEVPRDYNIYNEEAPTIIFNQVKTEEIKNLRFIQIDFSKDVLKQVSDHLWYLKVQSVLVEGGAKLLQSFLNADLADEKHVFRNEKLVLGTGVRAPGYNT